MAGHTKKTAAGEDPLFTSIRELIVSARKTVARGVDLVQVLTNRSLTMILRQPLE